eukprot:403334350
MLTKVLFASYSFGVGSIIYNLARTKLQNDQEQDIRKLREYDLSNEKINPQDLPLDCMVLAKYDPELNKDLKVRGTLLQNQGNGQESKVIFSKVLSCGNIVDSAKLFTQNFRGQDVLKMNFIEPSQELPLEIQLSKKVELFDLDTISQSNDYSRKSLQDRIKELYFKTLRKQDFHYIEKGLHADKQYELMVAGKIEHDKKLNKLVMRRPSLVIGSDRLEFYEFLGRKREVYGMQNRNWLKFCVGLTAVHFLLVRVPTLFSSYFGDQVGMVSEKLGAEDQSDMAIQMQMAKQRKEL